MEGAQGSAFRMRFGLHNVTANAVSSKTSASAARSPDGAKRNPGFSRDASSAPDFASLHPGYK